MLEYTAPHTEDHMLSLSLSFELKGKKNCFGRLLLNVMDILIRNIIFSSFHIKCRCKVKVLLQNKYRFKSLT